MKGLMVIVNMVLVLGSIVGIIWHLLIGQFGTAWLCVVPLIYAWGNCDAIVTEDK